MKKVLAIMLSVALVCLLFASCGGSSNGGSETANTIVGTWEYESGGYTYVFNEDGTGNYNGAEFTYTTDGSKLAITYSGSTAPFETEYSIDGDKLNIKDSAGSDTIYVKK